MLSSSPIDPLCHIFDCDCHDFSYMIGEVQYGGRVTDDYDKRLLNTFAKVWLSDALFTEGFLFYKGYPLLVFKLVVEYLKAIDVMSTIDPPQVYGLHPNADIT